MKFIYRLVIFTFFIANAIGKNVFPLIIMGGTWSPESRPKYSNLSRVCNIGFTHAFSYITEPNIGESRSLDSQVRVSIDFANTINNNCPQLAIVMGIPSDWIYLNRGDLITQFIESLNYHHIKVAYWLSDEVIYNMVNHGMSLESATIRAASIINLVEKKSGVQYIWIEPGNYGPNFAKILNKLSTIPFGIKSYDQYFIDKYGRLSNAIPQFNILNSTLITFQQSKVFPVCAINYNNKTNNGPNQEELNSILMSLYLNGADGFIFWEERWTTDQILGYLRNTFSLLKSIDQIGKKKFIKKSDYPMQWLAHSSKKDYLVTINNTNKELLLQDKKQKIKIKNSASIGVGMTYYNFK